MFSGDSVYATIKLATPKALNDIADWYGNEFETQEKKDGIYVSFVVNEQAFLFWALQYGLNIEIIEPRATREKYIDMLNSIAEKYKK